MPTWPITGTPLATTLRNHGEEASPGLLYSDPDRPDELERMESEVLATSKRYADDRVRMGYIKYADRPWLLAHAKDRAVAARDGESDESFRARIQGDRQLITKDAILAYIQGLVDDAGVVGTVAIFNLRRNKIFLVDNSVEATLTGGEWVELDGDLVSVTPAAPFTRKPRLGQDKILIAGSSANDGEFVVEDVLGDALIYTNAAGSAETSGTATIAQRRYDLDGNLTDSFADGYLNRGHRIGSAEFPNTGIVILPYGCTEALRQTVQSLVERESLFGVTYIVECRTSP